MNISVKSEKNQEILAKKISTNLNKIIGKKPYLVLITVLADYKSLPNDKIYAKVWGIGRVSDELDKDPEAVKKVNALVQGLTSGAGTFIRNVYQRVNKNEKTVTHKSR